MNSNLPLPSSTDSADEVKLFFNTYFDSPVPLLGVEVDVVTGFFKKRGFDDLAATSTAAILMQQAKQDGVNTYELLDTLKGLEDIQLSAVVAEILNYNRQITSVLGYKQTVLTQSYEQRNILV